MSVKLHSEGDREVERFFRESPDCRIFHNGEYIGVQLVQFQMKSDRVLWLAVPRARVDGPSRFVSR